MFVKALIRPVHSLNFPPVVQIPRREGGFLNGNNKCYGRRVYFDFTNGQLFSCPGRELWIWIHETNLLKTEK